MLELAALVRNIGSQAQKQAESRALRAARQEARPEKISIMVVDDSITMRKVTARILERHGIQSMTAKDGLDAVAMLQTPVSYTHLDVYKRQSENRKQETEEQNRRNQDAILRLLDELGNLAEGDLTVQASVTEDITGAIADSVNYAIEALRDLLSLIHI